MSDVIIFPIKCGGCGKQNGEMHLLKSVWDGKKITNKDVGIESSTCDACLKKPKKKSS